MSYKPISESQLEALLAPFEPGQLYWQKLEEVAEMARWQVVLHREALFERLDSILSLEWGFRLEVISPLPAVVVAHLELGGGVRSGMGEGLSLMEAQIAALSQAALAYGIAQDELFQPHQWHNLDWKALQHKTQHKSQHPTARAEVHDVTGVNNVTGANNSTGVLGSVDSAIPLSGATPPISTPQVPTPQVPTTPLEPAKPDPKQLINDLLDELDQKGLGLSSAKIMRDLNFKGYGETVEESRKLYSALKALLKKGNL